MKKIYLLITCCLVTFFAKSQNTSSISFDRVDGLINIPHDNVLSPTAAITISAWVKADAWSTVLTDPSYIVGKDDWSVTPNVGYSLRSTSTGELSFVFAGGNGWREVISTTKLPVNQWVYVSGTFDGTVLKAYIDGIEVGSANYSGTINLSTRPLYIGGTPSLAASTERLFDGKIDQLEVWNVALDATAIDQNKVCSPDGTETGLVGFWNFEEGTGTTTADQTANGNDGTFVGGTAWETDAQPICVTSIADNASSSSIKVYPNPNNGIFFVNSNNNISSIEIFNTLGEKIHTANINSNNAKIDLSEFNTGIYFYTLRGNNEIIKTGKVLIKE